MTHRHHPSRLAPVASAARVYPEPGYYWVRSSNPKFSTELPIIAELSLMTWHYAGLAEVDDFAVNEIVSDRIVFEQ